MQLLRNEAYSPIQIKPYVKVEIDTISTKFNKRKVSSSARLIFRSMSDFMTTMNSNVADFTYNEMLEVTGYSSKNVISEGLKELIDAKMIKKVGISQYRIIEGMYNGKTELDAKKIKSMPTIPRQHYIEQNKKTNKKVSPNIPPDDNCEIKSPEIETDPKKPFRAVKRRSLAKLSRVFGESEVQGMIKRLEFVYTSDRQIRSSATGLLYKALSEDYVIENKHEEIEKKRKQRKEKIQAQIIAFKAQDEAERKIRETNENERVLELQKDMRLMKKVRGIISLKYPKISTDSPVYEGLVNSYLLRAQ